MKHLFQFCRSMQIHRFEYFCVFTLYTCIYSAALCDGFNTLDWEYTIVIPNSHEFLCKSNQWHQALKNQNQIIPFFTLNIDL